MRQSHSLAISLFLIGAVCVGHRADLRSDQASNVPRPARADEQAFRGLYKELIEINTTLSVGSCTAAASAMKAHLVKAGYPETDLHLIAPPNQPKNGNLIALLRAVRVAT